MAEPYTPEEEAELRAFVQKYPKMRWPTDDWITNRDRLFATLDRERKLIVRLQGGCPDHRELRCECGMSRLCRECGQGGDGAPHPTTCDGVLR